LKDRPLQKNALAAKPALDEIDSCYGDWVRR
jgi:hypothetical protein